MLRVDMTLLPLHRALLCVVVIVSCRCALSSSSVQTFFLSKCLDEFGIRN